MHGRSLDNQSERQDTESYIRIDQGRVQSTYTVLLIRDVPDFERDFSDFEPTVFQVAGLEMI